jgi:hypothetical protein
VIAVWKEIEPLPRVLESPLLILSGTVLFGLAYAFVYRSVAAARPKGIAGRAGMPMRRGVPRWPN